MSGLAGAFMRSGEPVDREALRRMAATTPHRATGGSHIVREGPFGGIQQLGPIHAEPSRPASADDGGAVMLFDGRLDNRDELADRLSVPSSACRSWSDARLALRAWVAWRDESPARLVGDFAFVVWDPARRLVFCARDPMGVRPLFYYLSERALVFGSELRQLLAHPLVPMAPDETTIAGLLAGELARASDRTLYRDLRKLPHAHTLAVDATATRRVRYWSADTATELRLRDSREYADAFRDVFDRAVRARLRSPGPVGAYVSGGLDSSAVMASACAVAVDRSSMPTAFSLVFPGHPEADERRYSEALLRHLGAPFVQLVPPPPDPYVVQTQVRARLELPDFPHDATGDAVRRAMADRGIHVALTGSGGDVGLSGSHYHYADLLRRGRVVRLWRRYRDVAREPAMSWRSADLLSCAVWPLLPLRARRMLRPIARSLRGDGLPPWMAPGLAARTGLLAHRPPRRIPPGQHARTDIADGFENGWMHLALDMYQRGSLEWGIEDRHPFYDRRVIEFALSLPDEERWQNGRTRYVLRGAMCQRLPPEVCGRTDADKGDFSPVYPPALAALGGFEFFSGPLAIAEMGWVVPGTLAKSYERMLTLQASGDLAYGDVAFRLWVVAAIEIWHAMVFAGTSGRKPWNISQVGPSNLSPRHPATVA